MTAQTPPSSLRWLILVVVSLAMFGNYYIYDSISPLADVLKERLAFTDSQIGLLNAIYSIPNVVMVLVGGIVIDRVGTRRATLAFTGLCFLGSLLTAALPVLPVMAAGRLLFGLGAETMIVAVTTTIAKWFRGRELSFAFGLNLTLARLGSFAALNSPTWAKPLYEGWQGPLLVAAGFGLIAVVAAVAYFLVEARTERRFAVEGKGSTDKVVFKDLWRLGRSYWYVVALCVTFYSAVFPFQTFAVKFFMHTHGTTREEGGFLSSMLTLFAMICTPLFGYVVDRVGRRARMMMAGSFLLTPVYLMMAYTDVSLYVPMAMMGVSFSLIPAVMWPSVAYLVGQERLGTAYGLMTMIQNIGLAGFNLMVGWANDAFAAGPDHPAGYRPGMWVFSSLGVIGFAFAWRLLRAEQGPDARGLETIRAGARPAGQD